MIKTIFRALNAGGRNFHIRSSHSEALELSTKLRTWKEFNPAVFTIFYENMEYIVIVEWGVTFIEPLDLKRVVEFHKEPIAMFLWSDPEKKEDKE